MVGVKLATGADPGRDPTPKGGGGGGALWTPKLPHGTMCFVGARGAGDFVLGIQQGEFLLFDPMCLYSKYSKSPRREVVGSSAGAGVIYPPFLGSFA